MNIPDEGTIREYYELRKQLADFTKEMRTTISDPEHSLPFMQPGRLVQVQYMDYDFGWGAVVNFKPRRTPKNSSEDLIPQHRYVVDMLLKVANEDSVGTKTHTELPSGVRPPKDGEKSHVEVVPVMLSCIQAISHIRIYLPKELQTVDARNSVKKALGEVQKRFPDGIPLLDPIENMRIEKDSFKRLLRVSKIAAFNSKWAI
jgi:ATP-dependent RNA helicase DOB1